MTSLPFFCAIRPLSSSFLHQVLYHVYRVFGFVSFNEQPPASLSEAPGRTIGKLASGKPFNNGLDGSVVNALYGTSRSFLPRSVRCLEDRNMDYIHSLPLG